jgi:anti-sigma B factor antagonist
MLYHNALEIHPRETQGVMILELRGKLDMGHGDIALREYVQAMLERGNRQLILDLAHVSVIDQAGAGVLSFLAEEYQAQKGKLVLLRMDKVHAQIYEVARLETMMEFCGDEVDAVNSFFPDRKVEHYDILEYVEEHEHDHDHEK